MVTSANETLRKRVEVVLDMAVTTVSSLAESFVSGVPLSSEDAPLVKEAGKGATPSTDGIVPAQKLSGANDTPTEGDGTTAPPQSTDTAVDGAVEHGEEESDSEDEGGILQVHD